mgnify:FL=1|jgi:hypothetical protein|tara:strand:- start:524 stop:1714 length:1191 start_codon:yes stop_codon:yes gene_type:complete
MAKNTHLEHLEDDIFNQGSAGAANAVNFLESLRDMLTAGQGGANTKVTVKWDGAPAVICGKDPQTGQFFVGTKSVFNKTTPKIGYNEEFIDFHYEGAINGILKQCYRELSKLPIEGILQGDLLYTSTPPLVAIGGKRGYRFKPNTITYLVDQNSEMGGKVAKSKLGIVFHTRYSGSDITSLSASFGVDVSGLQKVKDIAVFSSTFQNVNGIANLTISERNQINNTIRQAKSNLKSGGKFLDVIVKDKSSFSPASMFKIYFNQVIRSGKIPTTSMGMAKGFETFLNDRYKKEIIKKKTEKSQKEWEKRRADSISFLNSNKTTMFAALAGFRNLMDAKNMVINKLKKIEGVGTFLETETGYRVTSPEGFVAIKDGTALKLVDRLEFSRANFTVAKDWG